MYGTTVRIFIFDILITVRIMPCPIPVSKPVIDLTFAPTSPQHISKGTLALLLHLSDQPSTGSSNLAGASGKEYQYRTLKRGMSKIRKRDRPSTAAMELYPTRSAEPNDDPFLDSYLS